LRRDQDFKLSMINLVVINSCDTHRVLSSSKTDFGDFLKLIVEIRFLLTSVCSVFEIANRRIEELHRSRSNERRHVYLAAAQIGRVPPRLTFIDHTAQIYARKISS
jgi:hypothetical protein